MGKGVIRFEAAAEGGGLCFKLYKNIPGGAGMRVVLNNYGVTI